jgi:hypothetical protein
MKIREGSEKIARKADEYIFMAVREVMFRILRGGVQVKSLWRIAVFFLFLVSLAAAGPSFGSSDPMVAGYSVSIRNFKPFSNGFEASLSVTSSVYSVDGVPITCEIYKTGSLVDIGTEYTDSDGDTLFEWGGLDSDTNYTAHFKIGTTVYAERSFYTDSSLEESPSGAGCNSGLSGIAGLVLVAIAMMFLRKKQK